MQYLNRNKINKKMERTKKVHDFFLLLLLI